MLAKGHSEQRYKNHLIGKTYFKQGHYQRAIDHYESTLHNFGPHIGLLCDLTYAYTLSGQYTQAYHNFQRVKTELPKASPMLHPSSLARTYLFLSKISFEWMEFSEAIHYLEEILNLFEPNQNDFSLERTYYNQAKMELLRYKSFLNFPSDKWSSLYGEISLIQFDDQRLSFLQYITLLTADVRHDGFAKSLLRLAEFEKKGLLKEDLALGLSEYIELSLIENGLESTCESAPAIEFLLNAKPRDHYDLSLQRILSKKNLDMETILFCLSDLTQLNPLGQLRLLNILISIIVEPNILNEVRKRREMILSSLTPENKSLVSHLLQLRSSDKNNHFNSENKCRILKQGQHLVIKGVKKEFPKSRIAEVLFCYMQKRRHISLEELTEIVWNTAFNESYYNRIWTAIKRINTCFKTAVDGVDIFATRKDGVYLSPQCQIVEED